MQIDLNCDIGEGCPHDEELMSLITSANIACGFHAGDASTAWRTLELARQNGVQAGAHPGFNDREYFGRRDLAVGEQQLFEEGVYQVGALIALGRAVGCPIRYIKPHGSLYHLACRDDAYARPMVRLAQFFGLPLVAQPATRMQVLSKNHCSFVAEGFADRRYQSDASLVPRSEPNALVEDPQEAVRQVERLIREGEVRTICVHGDNPHAVAFVRALRQALLAAGHELTAFAGS